MRHVHWFVNQTLIFLGKPLIAFRLVKWSCIYGTSEASPPAFALYGLLVLGALGDFQGGHEYANYAMGLLKDVGDIEYSFTIIVSTIIKSNVNPVTSVLKEYLLGYQVRLSK